MRVLVLSLVFCTGCWDFASLSNRLGDLAKSGDLASLDLAGQDLATAECPLVCPTGAYCADFETMPMLPLILQSNAVTDGGDATNIVSGVQHCGSHSAYLTTDGGNDNQYAQLFLGPPQVPSIPSPLYVRFWLMAPAAVQAYTLFTIIDSPTAVIANVGTASDGHWAIDAPIQKETTTLFTPGAWTCVSLAVTSSSVVLSGGGGDAMEGGSSSSIESAAVGIARGSYCDTDMGPCAPPTQLYIDDVVFSNTAISCP